MRKFGKLNMVETLTALLVCIIAVALVLPVCTNARNHSKQTICVLNARGLSQAWTLYHEDYNGFLVGGSTYSSTKYRWAERPLVASAPIPIPEGINPASFAESEASMNHESRMRGIRAGRLFPYTGSERFYHCPSDTNIIDHPEPYAVYRTYAISGLMNGEDNRTSSIYIPGTTDLKTFKMARKIGDIKSPSQKYVFVEEDAVDSLVHGAQQYNLGGFVIMGGNNYWNWWDIPALFHNDNSTLGFADGHAESHTMQDRRTIALTTHDRNEPPFLSRTQPDNEDMVYMNNGYFACD